MLTWKSAAGTTQLLYFAWRLPAASADEQQNRDTQLTQALSQDVIPRMLRAEDERALRRGCSNPAVRIPSSLMQFLLKEAGVQTHAKHRNRSRDAAKEEHIAGVLSRENDAFVSNLLAAGFDPLDMRCLNGRTPDGAFKDFIDCVHHFLTTRDLLAAPEWREVAAAGGSAPAGEAASVRPTPLAPNLTALHRSVMKYMWEQEPIAARLRAKTSKNPDQTRLRHSCPHPILTVLHLIGTQE